MEQPTFSAKFATQGSRNPRKCIFTRITVTETPVLHSDPDGTRAEPNFASSETVISKEERTDAVFTYKKDLGRGHATYGSEMGWGKVAKHNLNNIKIQLLRHRKHTGSA
jgi:hypothetical protein